MPNENQRPSRLGADSKSFGDTQDRHCPRAVIIGAVPDSIVRCAGGYSTRRSQTSRSIGILSGFAFGIANVIVVSSVSHVRLLELWIRAFDYANYVVGVLCPHDLVLGIDIKCYAYVLEAEGRQRLTLRSFFFQLGILHISAAKQKIKEFILCAYCGSYY